MPLEGSPPEPGSLEAETPSLVSVSSSWILDSAALTFAGAQTLLPEYGDLLIHFFKLSICIK